MTEQEWIACDRPMPMLEAIRGKVSDRKLRLFAVGCCYLLGLRPTEEILFGLDVAIRLAETGGKITKAQVRLSAGQVALDCGASEPVGQAYLEDAHGLPKRIALPFIFEVVLEHLACARDFFSSIPWLENGFNDAGLPAAGRSNLLRDVVGNPFRPVVLDRVWLTPDVLSIAHAAYDGYSLASGELERDRLAVLSDALEDAGCDDAILLDHLRSFGPHVRGCWGVDLILGKP